MRIIILNGPCGIGKSTIASKLHEEIPLSFLLNIDEQRRSFSQYREKREESRVASLKVSASIISSCLEMNHDVIIDKMLYETQVLDSFYEIAKKYNAEVNEIILWASKEVVMQRANARGWKKGGLLTPEKCEYFWHQIEAIIDKRPKATIINISNISEHEAYLKVKKSLKFD